MKTLALLASALLLGCLDVDDELETATFEDEIVLPGSSWLANGGFESGTSPWTFTGAWRATESNGGPYQRSGTAYAVLGGSNWISTRAVSQNVSIASTAKTATLVFYLDITSAESPQYPRDKLTLKIYDRTTGNLVRFPQPFTSGLQTETIGSYATRVQIDMLPYKGKQLRIEWSVWTDSTQPTQFLLDDVSVTGTDEWVNALD